MCIRDRTYIDLVSVLTGCDRSITRKFSYTDQCNNTGMCIVTYTWRVDTEVPVLTCPSTGLELGCNPLDTNGDGIPDAVATSVGWTDNCTPSSGTTSTFTDLESVLTGCDRMVVRKFSYTDGCNN